LAITGQTLVDIAAAAYCCNFDLAYKIDFFDETGDIEGVS
jgi:hypothetical protein